MGLRGKVWMHSPVAAYQSSTRAETVAGLLACMKHKRVTIYTDSKAFMFMHRRVCAKIAGRKVLPFAKWPNGDLAKEWHVMLLRRGGGSMRSP